VAFDYRPVPVHIYGRTCRDHEIYETRPRDADFGSAVLRGLSTSPVRVTTARRNRYRDCTNRREIYYDFFARPCPRGERIAGEGVNRTKSALEPGEARKRGS